MGEHVISILSAGFGRSYAQCTCLDSSGDLWRTGDATCARVARIAGARHLRENGVTFRGVGAIHGL